MSDEPKVRITVFLSGEADLDVDEVWPPSDDEWDDRPETVTAGAVKSLLEESGNKMQVLRDWGLDEDITVAVVVVDPDKRGHTEAEVWR